MVRDDELVYVIVVGSVVVHRPAGGGEHQIPRGPFAAIARDRRISLAVEIVVDRRGNVAVRPVDNLRRANRHGGEEIRRDAVGRSEEHTSELQSLTNLVCRLLLEKKKKKKKENNK